jgi:hypothetical protein
VILLSVSGQFIDRFEGALFVLYSRSVTMKVLLSSDKNKVFDASHLVFDRKS